jgi:hypothetical protein
VRFSQLNGDPCKTSYCLVGATRKAPEWHGWGHGRMNEWVCVRHGNVPPMAFIGGIRETEMGREGRRCVHGN